MKLGILDYKVCCIQRNAPGTGPGQGGLATDLAEVGKDAWEKHSDGAMLIITHTHTRVSISLVILHPYIYIYTYCAHTHNVFAYADIMKYIPLRTCIHTYIYIYKNTHTHIIYIYIHYPYVSYLGAFPFAGDNYFVFIPSF